MWRCDCFRLAGREERWLWVAQPADRLLAVSELGTVGRTNLNLLALLPASVLRCTPQGEQQPDEHGGL